MRRVLGAAAAALLAIGATPSLPAQAQDASATLQLLRQSPWSSAMGRSTVTIDVLATNVGDETLRDLQLVVSFGPRIVTQAEYLEVLDTGPASVIATLGEDVPGEIEPGGSQAIAITIDLAAIDVIDQTDPQVYPASVHLVAAGSIVATVVTPVIYLVGPPLAPMLAATWVELPAPIAFDPSGALIDPAFPSSLGPGGALRAPLDAIAASTERGMRARLDLAIDPLTLTQARDVADGYMGVDGSEVSADAPEARQAARFVETLGAITGDTDQVEVIANPYASPLLPAMLTADLDTELAAERVAGATVVTTLGASPAPTAARPAQGALDDESLSWLAGLGVSVILANADTVDRSIVQSTYAPAPTVPVATSSGPTTMVLPDPAIQDLFGRTDLLADPVRAAQVVLGATAVIWKQEPVPIAPIRRGIAIAPPPTLPAAMWEPLLERLEGAPFLAPVTATDLVAQIVPRDPNPELPLALPSEAAFEPGYAAEIRDQSDRIDAFASMVVDRPDAAPTLRRSLFLATTPGAVYDSSLGQPWIDAVAATTQGAFDVVTPRIGDEFTFTSREGTIPMVMGDPGDTALRVTIEARSNSFSFPDGDARTVVVDRPGQVVTFRVVANTSGQNAIQFLVKAPNGRTVADPITVVVRSTAANRIALLVTLAAALVLLALYSRRWFRRARSQA